MNVPSRKQNKTTFKNLYSVIPPFRSENGKAKMSLY